MNSTAVVVRFSALGDVVLSSGVLEYWQSALKFRFIFITKNAFAPVLENHPAIEHIIGLDTKDLCGSAWIRKARELSMRYAELPLIDLHASLRTRALRFFWKGRTHSYAKYALSRRIYHRTRHAWAGRRLLQFNVPQRYATALTAVSPAAGALLPHLYPRREEIAWARNMLKDKGFRGTNVRPVALHPYATHRNKEWPTSHWQELTRLLDARDIPWLVIGKNDSPAKWAASERNLTNQTTLRQSCAVLASCSRLVTGDSGPMHLACGVGTPVVALFGPTTRAWGFYPEGPKDVVLESGLQCRPCSLHGGKNCQRDRECMRTIHPQDVADSLAYD